ncbi:sigma-70 family RNA polymerase sigma factor [Natronoglycomyces albus]|uniref:Sigma-70 family RNA polymerase sigma factor n=2 Tax=Natronoglycomyces albus TaxID=2811108 RepID=A0A895XWY5_9ACTN|nr:sigma-70 family RNA polymerase sigma factor [Natronoglycomyces albus]
MDVDLEFEPYRRELIAYSYRMLGSAFEAEDAVQEAFLRAWKARDSFKGEASVRSWLYRIVTNVCLDMLKHSQRRARPTDLGPASDAADANISVLPESSWLTPIPDGVVQSADPAERVALRESIQLAFVAALQHLPPKQRAVLILREVLQWQAVEVAELLGITPAAVNSALQRARVTMSKAKNRTADPADAMDMRQKQFLAQYVRAFESYDLDYLTSLLHEDVVLSMPPISLWLCGPNQVRLWLGGHGRGCRGSRLIPAESANGVPALAQYRPAETANESPIAPRNDPAGQGRWRPWALHVLEIEDGLIYGMNLFMDTPELFEKCDLPPYLD